MTHSSNPTRIGATFGAGLGVMRPVAPPSRRAGADHRDGAAHGVLNVARSSAPARAASRADLDARFAAQRAGSDAVLYDAELVIYRLEEAGTALLCIPHSGYTTKLRSSSLDIVRNAIEAYGWGEKKIRPPVPSAAKIDRMDEALSWIPLIPRETYVLRRIVGARCLISPLTERHLYPWRRLAAALGADHKAIQRWHAQGIDLIVAALNGGMR